MWCSFVFVMGGALSTRPNSDQIAWHFPSWCVSKGEVTPELIALVKASWDRCMSGQSAPFLAAHATNPSLTPIVFFYDSFYTSLFDWIPQVKPLFKNSMHRQGRMLANIVRFIVHNLDPDNRATFAHNLTVLTKAHNVRGVQPEYYSVMGMTLVHTVRKCMGEVEFTEQHRHAWVVVYSKMMEVMIPVAVSGALPDKEEGRTIQVKPVWHVGEGKLAEEESACPVAHSRLSRNSVG